MVDLKDDKSKWIEFYNEQIKNTPSYPYQEFWPPIQYSQSPCPGCGHCPVCGRRTQPWTITYTCGAISY